MSAADLLGQGWCTLDGVVETPGAYVFDPLGIRVPKGVKDSAARLRVSGLVTQTRPWWSPVGVRARHLPRGRGRAVAAVVLHYGRSLLPFAVVPLAVVGISLGSNSPGTLALGLLGLLIAVSLVAHEAGHALALRWVSRGGPAIFVTRGADAALVRPMLAPRHELVVVCAGPCAPLIAGSPLLLAWEMCWPLAVAWFGISAAHLIGLVVPLGDGATLRATVHAHD